MRPQPAGNVLQFCGAVSGAVGTGANIQAVLGGYGTVWLVGTIVPRVAAAPGGFILLLQLLRWLPLQAAQVLQQQWL